MRVKEINKRTIKTVNILIIDKKQRIATVAQENIQTQKPEMSKAEICFGAIMAIAAIAGMWGVVSLLISLFLNY
jgi:hypothetical protein